MIQKLMWRCQPSLLALHVSPLLLLHCMSLPDEKRMPYMSSMAAPQPYKYTLSVADSSLLKGLVQDLGGAAVNVASPACFVTSMLQPSKQLG